MTKPLKVITGDDVRYIAGLSRIHLQGDEIQQLTKNLEDILHYVHKLEKLDVHGVEPTSHVLPIHSVYREDHPRPSLKQDEATAGAVEARNGFFKVPKVI
ncbi:MAG: Asp-tRNA(Asn)/Glu-tRNA(Gln) amidotransferase subunit GatC [Candidatus Omnitrophica bacterium]|nr:Asp-tRNA(Asn)/Glu-tRNA(Gln) amidotransferase subunit GatC [Candidatus Omnitrophota bacterium]